MYQRFYGLREMPFDLTANPRYLLLTAKYREALSNLKYGIAGRRGVTLLIGEAGTGKTTLVRAVQSEQHEHTRFLYLNNPALTRTEFIEFLARGFGLSERAAGSKTALLFELEHMLRQRKAQGVTTALLVDEAQVMPVELLEEVRLLANIEADNERLLPLVLAGQPQLAAKLNDPDLKQLKQRVALRCDLRPLDLKETAAYISTRLRLAGGDGTRLFSREAVELIYQCSRGIPRTISVICDNALVNGFAADQRTVGREIVYEVCRDFDLDPPKLVAAQQPASSPKTVAPPFARPDERARSREPEKEPMVVAASHGLFSSFNRPRRFSFF